MRLYLILPNSLAVQSRSELSYASATLPAGPLSNKRAILCQTQVYNSLDANSSAYYAVTVSPSTMSTTDMLSALNIQLLVPTSSSGSGSGSSSSSVNCDKTNQVISTASSILNTVNCTGISPATCQLLHRLPCSSSPHKCGPCSSSRYLGADGDDNSLCVDTLSPTSQPTRVKPSQPQPQQPQPAIGSCKSTSDCSSLQVCGVNGICTTASKMCPNSCSGAIHSRSYSYYFFIQYSTYYNLFMHFPVVDIGKGSCRYTNTASGLALSDCKVNDASCSAVCRCNSGFNGPACDVTDAELAAKVIRSTFQLVVY